MKKVSKIVLSVALVAFIASCGMLGSKDKRKKFTDVVEYNDYIVDIVKNTTDAWDEAIGADEEDYANEWTDSLEAISQRGLDNLNNLYPFKKDSTFQDAAKAYIGHMNKISKDELPEFVDIIFSGDFSDANNERLDELIEILDDQREDLFDKMNKAQKAFAKKHDYDII